MAVPDPVQFHLRAAAGRRMGQANSLFREICEQAPDLIQSVSADGRFAYVNPAWREALEYAGPDVAALRYLDIIHPDDRDHTRSVFADLLSGKASARIEARLVSRSGRVFLAEGSVGRRVEADGSYATFGIFRDITARQRARAELDRLFNLSLDMLCIATGDGYFKRVNPAFERALGYGRAELTSRSFLELVHPEDRERTLRAMEQMVGGEPVVDFRNRYRAKNGSWRWLQWRSTPVDERGLVYAVARDITEERRVHELLAHQSAELARSNADLEEFASAASHDLQAPLRAIDNLAGFLLEDLAGEVPPGVREHVARLRGRVGQMQAMVDDLLAYSRAGRQPGEVREVDTGALVHAVAQLLGPPPGIVVRTEGPMPVFATARSPLEQVLRNLIGNAVSHHDRSQGEVVVSAGERATMWEFAVADDGPGIPAEQQERVFSMFHRLRPDDTVGTGIGLALVKKIVERMGGRVWVEPNPGRGSVFRFTWPRRLEPAAEPGS